MRESFILARPGDTIFSDPRYAVMLITGHWHPKAHRDLISEIKKISCAWGSQQVDCWTHQARWQEGADKLAKRAALKCLSFENVFSTGVVDAPADNRSAGKTAPNPVNSVLGECL